MKAKYLPFIIAFSTFVLGVILGDAGYKLNIHWLQIVAAIITAIGILYPVIYWGIRKLFLKK